MILGESTCQALGRGGACDQNGDEVEDVEEASNRPLAFHSNSIQPFPPCALPPLLHPRLKAPSRSYPVRQLLLHHVPRWNVHRLHRCGLWNAGASLCHHKQGGKLVCNIHTYIPSSLTYIQTGRGSPLTSIVTASILTASSTRQGPPPPPCAWRAAPEPTPARQVRAFMVQLVCTVVPACSPVLSMHGILSGRYLHGGRILPCHPFCTCYVNRYFLSTIQ